MTFTVAIVGRPNVGKSTLFNRLTGLQHALVDDQPGITRDWRQGKGRIGPLTFHVLDTAGLEDAEENTLQARMTGQTLAAIKEADVALFVVDGRAGLTPTDKHFASLLRKQKKSIVLVVNKAEGKAAEAGMLESYSLGFGDPVAISAAHGEGMGELYSALEKFAPEEKEVDDEETDTNEAEEEVHTGPINIAIIGRPNVGKSTLMNALLKTDRVLTGPEAGITRDAIAVDFTYGGRELKLVDTAGMRRKANIGNKVEKMAVHDSLRAIQYAEVVILMLDASQPLEKQDNTIASLIEQEGRAMVIAVNKWDTVKDQTKVFKDIEERLSIVLPQVKGIPLIPISAKSKSGFARLMEAAFEQHARWNKRISTAELNRWLEAMLDHHSPPLISGRRLKIRYMTQAKARPPTFTLFSNLSEIPDHYSRYLVNGMRERFDLLGVPIRLKVKKNKNPYKE